MAPFSFLVSEVTPGHILTFEDLELGTSDEREHETLIFPYLGYLTQLTFLVPSICLARLWRKIAVSGWVERFKRDILNIKVKINR